jgi:hypothetical protein
MFATASVASGNAAFQPVAEVSDQLPPVVEFHVWAWREGLVRQMPARATAASAEKATDDEEAFMVFLVGFMGDVFIELY